MPFFGRFSRNVGKNHVRSGGFVMPSYFSGPGTRQLPCPFRPGHPWSREPLRGPAGPATAHASRSPAPSGSVEPWGWKTRPTTHGAGPHAVMTRGPGRLGAAASTRLQEPHLQFLELQVRVHEQGTRSVGLAQRRHAGLLPAAQAHRQRVHRILQRVVPGRVPERLLVPEPGGCPGKM